MVGDTDHWNQPGTRRALTIVEFPVLFHGLHLGVPIMFGPYHITARIIYTLKRFAIPGLRVTGMQAPTYRKPLNVESISVPA